MTGFVIYWARKISFALRQHLPCKNAILKQPTDSKSTLCVRSFYCLCFLKCYNPMCQKIHVFQISSDNNLGKYNFIFIQTTFTWQKCKTTTSNKSRISILCKESLLSIFFFVSFTLHGIIKCMIA